MTEVTDNQQATDETVAVGKQLAFDPNVKHPLFRGWTLWFDSQLTSGKRPGGNDWGANIKEVYSFHSVEDFWRLYNNITLPSQLQIGCSYNLFKEGIEPKWEDPSNAKGGKWTLIIQKTKGLLDKLWLWLILGCIGEMLEGMEDVCGIVVNVRKGQDKLCVWTKDADNQDIVERMGLSIKKALELPDQFPLGYQGHFQKNTRQNKYEV